MSQRQVKNAIQNIKQSKNYKSSRPNNYRSVITNNNNDQEEDFVVTTSFINKNMKYIQNADKNCATPNSIASMCSLRNGQCRSLTEGNNGLIFGPYCEYHLSAFKNVSLWQHNGHVKIVPKYPCSNVPTPIITTTLPSGSINETLLKNLENLNDTKEVAQIRRRFEIWLSDEAAVDMTDPAVINLSSFTNSINALYSNHIRKQECTLSHVYIPLEFSADDDNKFYLLQNDFLSQLIVGIEDSKESVDIEDVDGKHFKYYKDNTTDTTIFRFDDSFLVHVPILRLNTLDIMNILIYELPSAQNTVALRGNTAILNNTFVHGTKPIYFSQHDAHKQTNTYNKFCEFYDGFKEILADKKLPIIVHVEHLSIPIITNKIIDNIYMPIGMFTSNVLCKDDGMQSAQYSDQFAFNNM